MMNIDGLCFSLSKASTVFSFLNLYTLFPTILKYIPFFDKLLVAVPKEIKGLVKDQILMDCFLSEGTECTTVPVVAWFLSCYSVSTNSMYVLSSEKWRKMGEVWEEGGNIIRQKGCAVIVFLPQSPISFGISISYVKNNKR